MKKTILLSLIILQSCAITKSAEKKKTESKTETTLKDKTQTNNIDFSETNTDEFTLEYIPSNPNLWMETVNAKGDTIKSKNTIVKRSNKNTNTQNNKVQVINSDLDTEIVSEESLKEKESQKEEKADTTIFLYAIIGVMLVMFFALFLLYKLIDKRINTLTNLINIK